MYKHEIIVHKPAVPVYSGVVQHRSYTPGPPPREYKTQQEYQSFLDTLEFVEGDYITLVRQEVDFLRQVWQVTAIQDDFAKVDYKTYTPFHPCPIHVRQLATSPQEAVASRWESVSGYRKLTQAEKNRFYLV